MIGKQNKYRLIMKKLTGVLKAISILVMLWIAKKEVLTIVHKKLDRVASIQTKPGHSGLAVADRNARARLVIPYLPNVLAKVKALILFNILVLIDSRVVGTVSPAESEARSVAKQSDKRSE